MFWYQDTHGDEVESHPPGHGPVQLIPLSVGGGLLGRLVKRKEKKGKKRKKSATLV
jgi:hypothetical protein